MAVTDLEALQVQLADLQAKLAALAPAAPPPPVSVAAEPTPPRPVRLHTLTRGVEVGGLHRDVRVVRQLAEAVALCRGATLVGSEIPADWVPQLRALAAARTSDRAWRVALAEVGLEAPSDLETQARVVRLELDDLWSRLLPLVGLTLDGINSTAKITLTASLKRVLA